MSILGGSSGHFVSLLASTHEPASYIPLLPGGSLVHIAPISLLITYLIRGLCGLRWHIGAALIGVIGILNFQVNLINPKP